MTLDEALEQVPNAGPGTLATLFADGRPQMSVVGAVVVGGRLWISATQTRVKTRNVRRDPRVTIAFGYAPWFAIEGRARILEGEGIAEKLRAYYRLARGEHPDWAEYDAAMVADQRCIIEIDPEHAYP